MNLKIESWPLLRRRSSSRWKPQYFPCQDEDTWAGAGWRAFMGSAQVLSSLEVTTVARGWGRLRSQVEKMLLSPSSPLLVWIIPDHNYLQYYRNCVLSKVEFINIKVRTPSLQHFPVGLRFRFNFTLNCV